MIALAWLFVLLGGVPLVGFALTARPANGESLMGLHVVVAPLALALTLGLGLGVAAEWQQTVLPAAVLYAALPGWLVAVVVLLFGCFGRSQARLAQLLTLLAVAAPIAVLAGARIRPEVQLAGGVYVVALGIGALCIGLMRWMGPRWRRRMARGTPPSPDSFEGQLAARQREDWEQRQAAAGFEELLGLTRSVDPGVRRASVERLVASPDFEATLVEAIATDTSRDAASCVRALTPAQRAKLAPHLRRRLAEAREGFLRRVAAGENPEAEVELAMRLLDAGVGTYLAGGDLRGPLVEWRDTFGSHPGTAKLGKELRRVLQLVRVRRWFGRVR
jgi:hypothetical protein